MKTINHLQSFRASLRESEGVVVDIVSALVPWLASLIPASIAVDHIIRVLGLPVWVAVVTGAVIEGLGLAAVNTILKLWEYNRTRKPAYPRAPLWPALLAAGVYFSVVIVVNVLLDLSNPIHVVAKALLSLLSPVAALLIAIRAVHAERLEKIAEENIKAEADKQAEKEKRREARQALLAVRQVAELAEARGKQPASSRQYTDWGQVPADVRGKISGMSTAEVASVYGVPERTARAWHARAAANGHEPAVQPDPAGHDWLAAMSK